MEKWIIKNAEEVGINLSDYDLPNDFEALKKQAKSIKTKKDDRFKRLFKALKKQEASGVALLTEWINYLKEHPYDADLDFFRTE